MKTMLLAAAAVLSLGVGAAYADSEGGSGEDGGTIPNTYFTELPGVDAQQGEQPNNVAVNAPTAPTHSAAAVVAPRSVSGNGS
ncbi:MAG TPA: hypothetical protein VL614_24420 [Acetobacteraceae bacterium]|jgi:hypothetical protein|nr:hypothetical protein [Acetobacteraceae bacterium]